MFIVIDDNFPLAYVCHIIFHKNDMTEKIIPITIGNKIKLHRRRNNITQNDLAIKCNFEKATMSRIESGKANPTVATLVKISKALDIHISELFTEEHLGEEITRQPAQYPAVFTLHS